MCIRDRLLAGGVQSLSRKHAQIFTPTWVHFRSPLSEPKAGPKVDSPALKRIVRFVVGVPPKQTSGGTKNRTRKKDNVFKPERVEIPVLVSVLFFVPFRVRFSE